VRGGDREVVEVVVGGEVGVVRCVRGESLLSLKLERGFDYGSDEAGVDVPSVGRSVSRFVWREVGGRSYSI